MKILEFDRNKKHAKFKVESQLDLWHLQKILEPKDLVSAKTVRTIFLQREEKKEKCKKVSVVLTVKMEKLDFHEYLKKLRIIGKIIEAPEDIQLGDYHTIEIGVGDVLSVTKTVWKTEQIERIERAKIKVGVANHKTIEEFLIHVNKNDGLAAYGLDHVKFAAESNAVKILLLLEDEIKNEKMESLMRLVEEKGGEIKLVSKKMELGQKFCKIYGIGSILRFPIN